MFYDWTLGVKTLFLGVNFLKENLLLNVSESKNSALMNLGYEKSNG